MEVGTFAQRISQQEKCGDSVCNESLTAGLLHDAGMLVFSMNMSGEYEVALDRAMEGGSLLTESERQIFGCTHAEIGAYLLGIWGLPDTIVEAVAYHHEPSLCHTAGFCPLAAVHVADVISHRRYHAAGQPLYPELDIGYLHRLGLYAHLKDWAGVLNPSGGSKQES